MDPDSDSSDPDPLRPFARRFSLLWRHLPSVLFVGVVATCVAAADVPGAGGARDAVSGAWLLGGFLIGLIGSSFFTILDNALFALDSDEIDEMRVLRPDAAALLVRLRSNLDRTWFTLLAGSLVFGLLFALSVGHAVVGYLGAGNLLHHAAVAVIVSVPALLVFGEILPGLLAARWFKRLAPFSASCVRVSSWILLPLTLPALAVVRGASRLVGIDAARDRYPALDVEKRLLAMVGVGEADVTLEEEEREMIDHALEFGESTAADIMTPRDKIVGFSTEDTQQQVIEGLRKLVFGRVVVYDGSLDGVVGILHAKKILLDPDTDYHRLLSPPLFVSADTDLVDLIAEMRRHRTQIVVVIDEYGATAGIVSMNDLLRELVGRLPREEAEPEGAKSTPGGEVP
ncbi:DUF21 domain-containing protein [Candidatus Sumerlaeota bacterium]|nr:DUF21 domain-containing protein [Candidatus Sumerlaeota bacterium]